MGTEILLVKWRKNWELGIDKVYKLMRRKHLPRRNRIEANRLAFLRKPASFTLVLIKNKRQQVLKALGTALYWAEGYKRGAGVDFTNSDEKMVQLFVRFLKEICGVNNGKLSVYLYCYPQHDPEALKCYWSAITGIPLQQFTKPYVRTDAEGKVGPKLKYGLVHIRYHDKKLVLQLRQWAKEYFETFEGRGTQAANEVAL